MNSVDYFGTVFSNIIKASQAAKNATELIADLESQAVQIFNAMQQEISELEKQSQVDKTKISELESKISDLESEVSSLKSKIYVPKEPEIV